MVSIPKIVHQTWSSRDLPVDFERFQLSWRKHHAGWEYRFYDDEGCRSFIEEYCPELLAVYDAYPRQIQRVDLFRYLVVNEAGGVYADMDMECLRPLGRLFEGRKCVFSVEAHLTMRRQRELSYRGPYQIGNCIFASIPGHPFLQRIIRRSLELADRPIASDEDVEETTGPRMLTRLYESLPEEDRQGVAVLPQIFLLPPKEYPNFFPFGMNMYAKHHFRGTWKEESPSRTWKRRWIERNRLPRFW